MFYMVPCEPKLTDSEPGRKITYDVDKPHKHIELTFIIQNIILLSMYIGISKPAYKVQTQVLFLYRCLTLFLLFRSQNRNNQISNCNSNHMYIGLENMYIKLNQSLDDVPLNCYINFIQYDMQIIHKLETLLNNIYILLLESC